MKNTLKKIAAASIAAFLLACGSNNSSESNETNTLTGTWEIVKAEGMMAETNMGTKYIFTETELTLSKDDFDNKASTTITDSTFTWDNGNMVMEYAYRFEKGKLLVNPVGSDQHFTLEKK